MQRGHNGHGFSALRAHGGILPPEFLVLVSSLKAKQQSAADYGLTKSLNIRDELARYWRIATDLYTAYDERRQRAGADPGKVGVAEWLVPLLRDVFGYAELAPSPPVVLAERTFPITHHAFGGAVPFVLTTSDHDLDRADPAFGDQGRRRAPQGLMQELLNADPKRIWGFIANGSTIRLLHDNPSLTRPAYIEADLEQIFQEQQYADFAALWLLIHASRLRPITTANDCILETWRKLAHETGERALEHLRDGVTEALRALGNGFLAHPANEPLRAALADNALRSEAFFEELLRLIYRLLFLFATEERGLLFDPKATAEGREIFKQGYALARLRDRALRQRHYDRHDDLWRGLSIVFWSLAAGEPRLGLPALGGLFLSEHCPNLDQAAISNAALLNAIYALAFFRSDSTLSLVNYRDMGIEELGSVYESLLELHPTIEVDATPWTFGFLGAETTEQNKGSARRLTGSYYTPAPLVNELIISTLEPVMVRKLAGRPNDPRAALLDVKLVDPACGSGHFLLAAARRIAAEIARIEACTDTPEEPARQHALREVVQHCIYGVDRNPLAVELCKTALWIETVEPGKPLAFLDAHIQCGDSLVGVLDPTLMIDGIPDEAYDALTGDEKSVCKTLKKANRELAAALQGSLFDQESFQTVAVAAATLDTMPEDTLEQINQKKAAWGKGLGAVARSREELRANLFVAAFLARKTRETANRVPINEDLNRLERGMLIRSGVDELVADLAARHRFFHWYLAFPEVFGVRSGASDPGRFDVVIGNPPWERVKLQEKEWFAATRPDIAGARNASERKRLIDGLRVQSPLLYQAFIEAHRRLEGESHFIRCSQRYPLCGRGDINTFAVFAELKRSLVSGDGQVGTIVPTAIATDDSTKRFFQAVVDTHTLVSLFDFENKLRLFPAVAPPQKFCLLTFAGQGGSVQSADFAFFCHAVEDLRNEERHVSLTASDIALLNPNTRTCPIFRSKRDAELTKSIYRRIPVLISDGPPELNPWRLSIRRIFDMNKTDVLRQCYAGEGSDHPAGYVQMYESKLMHQFDHRYNTFDGVPRARRFNVKAFALSVGERHGDPDLAVQPRYWIPMSAVVQRLPDSWNHRWLLAWRDVTNTNTNRRSVVACILPKVGTDFTIRVGFPAVPTGLAVGLLCNLNSFCLDYIARQMIGGMHLSDYILKQLPILEPSIYSTAPRWSPNETLLQWLLPRAMELTYTAHDVAEFAREQGYSGPPFRWDEQRRHVLASELDAAFFHLYGLSRNDVEHVLGSFSILRTQESAEFGEYRTARLILSLFDALQMAGEGGETFQSQLAPPAAILA